MLLLSAAQAVSAWANETAHAFDIPSGRAAQTLKQFAAQAQCEIVFLPELSGEILTRPVHGELSAKAALDEMLEGTGLIARQDKTGVFAVRRVEAPAPRTNSAGVAGRSAQETLPEIIKLSPFVVPAESVGRYTASEATSGTRVRVSLMDSPQSVSVITRDLIDDIGATRALDAAKYVAGVSESTIPNAQDRTNIRGFQTDGATIDGFSFFSYANVDPAIVDRIEVVKGPNAILSPQFVQGTINLVSKKPEFRDRGYVSAELGRYNADRAELDVNRVVAPGKLALRVVAAAQRSHDQADGNFSHTWVAMPTLTYAFGDAASLTLQAQYYNATTAAYGGLPIDVQVGTNDEARLLNGIPTDLDLYSTAAARRSVGAHYRLFFTAKPSERLSVRLAVNTSHWHGATSTFSLGAPLNSAGNPIGTIALDPNTGVWVRTGIADNFPTYPRAASISLQSRTYFNLQNDYAYEREIAGFKSTTLVGGMLDYLRTPGCSFTSPTAPLEIRRAVIIPPLIATTMTGNSIFYTADQQIYLNEALAPINGRFLLSGGLAYAWYRSYVNDQYQHRTARNAPHALLPNAGIVAKLNSAWAVFADVSRQSTPIAPSTTSTMPSRLQDGRQLEVGARTQLLDQRVFASATYFTITQNNFAVPNPANSSVPAPAPSLPPLFTDLRIRGVEFELRAALTPQLSIVGSASLMHARNPVGQVFRGIAERSAATWIDYAFARNSRWRGFSIGVGLDYLGRRAGDIPSSTPTAASTPNHLVMPQPSFWLPARTLVNVGVTYRLSEYWKAQLNIDNVLNERYLAASTSRNTVFPGTPINPRLTISRSF